MTHGAVAKSGIDSLSAQLAIELGPRGITSNVIAPGPIDGTEGVRRLIATGKVADRSRTIPLGRLGSLKDMGDAVVYLFSDAGSFVTGAVLVGKYRSPLIPFEIDTDPFSVDGGAWRTHSGQPGGGFEYPDTVLSDEPFSVSAKRSKM